MATLTTYLQCRFPTNSWISNRWVWVAVILATVLLMGKEDNFGCDNPSPKGP